MKEAVVRALGSQVVFTELRAASNNELARVLGGGSVGKAFLIRGPRRKELYSDRIGTCVSRGLHKNLVGPFRGVALSKHLPIHSPSNVGIRPVRSGELYTHDPGRGWVERRWIGGDARDHVLAVGYEEAPLAARKLFAVGKKHESE